METKSNPIFSQKLPITKLFASPKSARHLISDVQTGLRRMRYRKHGEQRESMLPYRKEVREVC